MEYGEAKKLGLIKYYDGKPCKNGHIADRFVSSRICVVCNASRLKQWKIENREKYLACPSNSREKQKEYHARWVKSNPGRVKEMARRATAKWRASDPDRSRKQSQEWRRNNRDRTRAASARSKAKDPIKTKMMARVYKSRRRARKLKSGGNYFISDVRQLFKLQNGKCAYCRSCLSKKYHVDHIMPLARGGVNDKSNLQLLCESCNHKKWARDPITFVREEFGLLV